MPVCSFRDVDLYDAFYASDLHLFVPRHACVFCQWRWPLGRLSKYLSLLCLWLMQSMLTLRLMTQTFEFSQRWDLIDACFWVLSETISIWRNTFELCQRCMRQSFLVCALFLCSDEFDFIFFLHQKFSFCFNDEKDKTECMLAFYWTSYKCSIHVMCFAIIEHLFQLLL